MGLEKLAERIYYIPHQPEFDRPMLAYLCGSRYSLAIDAGYSASHVDDFYNCLEEAGFKKPDFTVITHWHYDHTFGLHHIHGASIAHGMTNQFLREQRQKAGDSSYIDFLKKEDSHFEKEYRNQQEPDIVPADLEFQEKIVLNLGDLTAVVFHTESPHSEDTVCIYVPEEKTLFLGDSTSEDFFNNCFMDKDKLRKLFDVIEQTDCVYCILSHAEPLRKEELLEYLNGVLAH